MDEYEFENDSSESSFDHVASTPIIMVSLPDTYDDGGDDEAHTQTTTVAIRSSQQDVFQTPPEDSHPPTSEGKTPMPEPDRSDDDDRQYEDAGEGRGIIVAYGDGAVDLGRDTDLGFLEAEAAEFRVSRREMSPERVSSESPLKKLRVAEPDSGNSEPQRGVGPNNPGSSSGGNVEIDDGEEESGEEGLDERKVDSSSDGESERSESAVEEAQSESEGDGVSGMEDSGREECLEEVMGRMPNVTIEELRWMESQWQRRRRALPPTIGGKAGLSETDGEEGVQQKEIAILDMLKLLKHKHNDDGNDKAGEVDSSSFLEISRRRGMTFPRPSWWPEGRF